MNGAFTGIITPGVPTGINNAGQIVGNSPGIGGYLFSNGVTTPIILPNGFSAIRADGINNLGQVVGLGWDSLLEWDFRDTC